MKEPLAEKLYQRPFAELYDRRGSWSFYGIYLRHAPAIRTRPPKQLVSFATRFFGAISRSAVAAISNADVAYPEAKRTKVRRHLTRERSGRLAQLAKLRDEFTCQVCHINFSDLYGKLGQGYAEAHHRLPIASPQAEDMTRAEHLVTVCCNCHKMLHRLPANRDGIAALQKLFTANWPSRTRT